jgi:hypothetical protein
MAQTGQQMKLVGLERASSRHAVDLRRAQQIAELMAGMGRIISADDVRELFEVQHGRPLEIGNALGSLFTPRKKWEWVGRVPSKRPSSHARWVSQWQLKQAYRPAPQPFEVGVENGVRFCLKCGMENCICPNPS